MSDRIPRFVLLVAGALLLSAANGFAADWPMFGRDQTRNPVSPEQNPPTDWDFDESRNIKWVAELGSMTCGDPVVADGLVWVGTNSRIFKDQTRPPDASVLACFRETTGELLYTYVSARLKHRDQDWPYSSLACSPLIEGDRLWFATNRWEAICLDIGPLKRGEADPKLAWKVDMREELRIHPNGATMNYTRFSSFASWENRLFLLTGNGVDPIVGKIPAPEAPSLVCFDKETAEVLWTDNSPGANLLSGQWASPLVVEIEDRVQVIAPQGDGWVRAFNAKTGDLIWQFDMNDKTSKWSLGGSGTRNNILATPVFYQGRIYLAAGQQPNHGQGPGRLCCIDPTKRGDISSEIAVDADGHVLPHRRIRAIDPEQGEQAVPNPNSGLVWEFSERDADGDGEIEFHEAFGRSLTSVAIKDDLLFATTFTGIVHCLDAKTGQQHWTYDTFAPLWGAPLIVDDKVYVADGDGDVSIFRLSADPRTAMNQESNNFYPINENQKGSSEYLEGRINTSPIYANGTLYIAARTHLYAIATDREQRDPSANSEEVDRKGSNAGQRPGPRSAFVPTPQPVVEKMLELANIQKTETVVDLGSGDGRIVIAAAKKYGCRARGYEIDDELVTQSRRTALEKGVADRVRIERADLFTADLSQVDVVFVYLLPEQLERLMPQFRKLKPGSRIVSHYFIIPGIEPDKTVKVESDSAQNEHPIHLWTTPLKGR